MNLQELSAPFPPEDIKYRKGPNGTQLAYVTARAIQDRLDKVVGPANWKNEFREWTTGTPGVLCGLSIRIGDEWVTKWDGAEQTDISPFKGGLSDALKRAAVQWGMCRELYDEGGTAGTARQSDEARTGSHAVRTPVQPAHGAVVNPDTAHPPTEKQVAFYLNLLNSPVFDAEYRKRGMEWLATKATRQLIKDQIDHMKTRVDAGKVGAA